MLVLQELSPYLDLVRAIVSVQLDTPVLETFNLLVVPAVSLMRVIAVVQYALQDHTA